MSFPYIQVAGSARERGITYGREARVHIEAGWGMYHASFRKKGHTDSAVAEIAQRFQHMIGEAQPAMLEEMAGIAEGSGVDLDFIVAMNARTEILRWQEDGCTGIACLPPVTRDGHMLLAQNWDWMPETIDTTVLLHARPDEGVEFITLVEGGLLARSGLNAAGIGVTGNYLQTSDDFGNTGLPITVIRRLILTSPTYAQAIGSVLNTPRAFSSNHLIASSEGDAVDLEATPGRVYTVVPDGGLLAHANHFVSPLALTKVHDTGVERLPDSLYRDRRLRGLVEQSVPAIDPDVLRSSLQDHFGAPAAVCRHSGERSDGSISTTVASVVMDLSDGRMWVAQGAPCESVYDTYKLDSAGA